MADLNKKDVQGLAKLISFFSVSAAIATFFIGFHYLPFVTDIGVTLAVLIGTMFSLIVLVSIGNTYEGR